MSRIDRSLIRGMSEEDMDEFTCGICHEIFVNPMVTHCCRQTYCNDCINEWLSKGGQICPNDRKPLSMNDMSPAPRAMVNLLNNIRVKCNEKGSESVNKISEMDRQCDVCGLGRQSEDGHNCIQNLKVKIESIASENKRLIQNQRLKPELMPTNANRSDLFSISGIDSLNGAHRSDLSEWPLPSESSARVRTGNPINRSENTRVLSEKMEHFLNGKFKLHSKFKMELMGNDRIENRFLETVIEINVNDNSFSLVRLQEGDDPIVKRFILGKLFDWVHSDGRNMQSIMEYRPNIWVPSSCCLIETMYDQNGKTTVYQYDFNILTKSLTIEWTLNLESIAELKKNETRPRIVNVWKCGPSVPSFKEVEIFIKTD